MDSENRFFSSEGSNCFFLKHFEHFVFGFDVWSFFIGCIITLYVFALHIFLFHSNVANI